MAAILVGVAAAARLLDRGPAGFPDLQLSAGQSPEAWEPVLVAAASLCISGLALRRSRWLAWFATGVGAALGAIDLMGLVRDQLGDAAPSAVPVLVAISVAAAIAAGGVTTLIALTVANDEVGGRTRSAMRLAARLGFAVAGTLQAAVLVRAILAATATTPWDPVPWVRGANRFSLGLLALDLTLAAVVVIAPRVHRAWLRSGGSTFVGALAEEFLPGLRSRADLAAAAERERLAADLHARVVPELRRAAATASTAGVGSNAEVLGALDEIETLMAERHSVVLEEFGLLAALEWLAERTTARAGAAVEIEVGDPSEVARPPRAVERAAFRVALLAVDNATRHAPLTPIAISVNVMSRAVRLVIADHGPGIEVASAEAARRAGHRGLSDMEAFARAVGGTVEVSGTDGRSGTEVTFAWMAH